MLFGGEMFSEGGFHSIYGSPAWRDRASSLPSRRWLEALILALRRIEDSMHVLPPLTNFLLLNHGSRRGGDDCILARQRKAWWKWEKPALTFALTPTMVFRTCL